MSAELEAEVAALGTRWGQHMAHMPDAPPGQMVWLQDDAAIRAEALALLLASAQLRDFDLSKGSNPATAIPVRFDALWLLARVLTDTEPRDTMNGHGEVPNWRARGIL